MALSAMVLAGCGTTRSVEAFCDTVGDRPSVGDVLQAGGLAAGIEAALEFREDYFDFVDDLEASAPDDVADEMGTIAASMADTRQRSVDQAGDPLGALASTVAASVDLYVPVNRVEEFSQQHCGTTALGPDLAQAAQRAGTPEAPPDGPTPEPGDDDADAPVDDGDEPAWASPRREGDDLVVDLADVEGHNLCAGADGQREVSARNAAVTADVAVVYCGATVAGIALDEAEVLWTESFGDGVMSLHGGSEMAAVLWEEHLPAEGLTAPGDHLTVTALDAATGEVVWDWQLFGPDASIEDEGDYSPVGRRSIVEFMTPADQVGIRLPEPGYGGTIPEPITVFDPTGSAEQYLGVENDDPDVLPYGRGTRFDPVHGHVGVEIDMVNPGVNWRVVRIFDLRTGDVAHEMDEEESERGVNHVAADVCSPYIAWSERAEGARRLSVDDADFAFDTRDGSTFELPHPPSSVTAAGVLIQHHGLVSVDADGERWRLDGDVVADWRVHDGEVYVENHSGEWFRVDADGAEERVDAAPPEPWGPRAGSLGWSAYEVAGESDQTLRLTPPSCAG